MPTSTRVPLEDRRSSTCPDAKADHYNVFTWAQVCNIISARGTELETPPKKGEVTVVVSPRPSRLLTEITRLVGKRSDSTRELLYEFTDFLLPPFEQESRS